MAADGLVELSDRDVFLHKGRLEVAIEQWSRTKDIAEIESVLSVFENAKITCAVLTITRIAVTMQTLRKTTPAMDKKISSRAKALIKRWKDIVYSETQELNVANQTKTSKGKSASKRVATVSTVKPEEVPPTNAHDATKAQAPALSAPKSAAPSMKGPTEKVNLMNGHDHPNANPAPPRQVHPAVQRRISRLKHSGSLSGRRKRGTREGVDGVTIDGQWRRWDEAFLYKAKDGSMSRIDSYTLPF
eukprot:m.80716 g.80716  ORF g.80716 m.80716 type:complete len:245 (+) comp12776_c0_seq2:302-1036(+)